MKDKLMEKIEEAVTQIMLRNLPVTVIDTKYWNSAVNELTSLISTSHKELIEETTDNILEAFKGQLEKMTHMELPTKKQHGLEVETD